MSHIITAILASLPFFAASEDQIKQILFIKYGPIAIMAGLLILGAITGFIIVIITKINPSLKEPIERFFGARPRK